MPPQRKEYLRYRYGVCLKEDCPLCLEKLVQQVAARKEFVCEECGRPLREVPPPKASNRSWLKYVFFFLIAAALALGIYMLMESGYFEEEQMLVKDSLAVDSVKDSVVEDTVADAVIPEISDKEQPSSPATQTVINNKTVIIEKHYVEKQVSAPVTPRREPVAEGPHVPYGVYSGPANGLGGSIRVTRNYPLDLHDGSVLDLQPGNEIQQTKFKDGDLKQGVWVHDGERQFFTR